MCASYTAVGALASFGVHVHGGQSITELHAWPSGGFGELVHEQPTQQAAASSRAAANAATRAPSACTLQLTAVEAFYLAFGAQQPRLTIVRPRGDGETALSDQECWTAFCAEDSMFPQLLAAYRALRTAGWHIRDGIKFGCDFTLYDPKGGPSAHATHSVLVTTPLTPERSWLWLQGYTRLCHQVSKQFLLCCVELPTSADLALRDGPPAPCAAAIDSAALGSPNCLLALEVSTVQIGSWSAGKEHAGTDSKV